MMDVAAFGILRSLHSDQVLVVSFTAFESQPRVLGLALVLVAFDKVPAQDEVLGNVINAWPYEPHTNIVPGHSSIFSFGELVLFPVFHGMKVHNTVIVEILTRKDFMFNSCGVNISHGMLMGVPPAEAQVKSANEGHLIVNHDELFVVCPVEGHIASVLQDIMVGMAHNSNVAMTWGAFRAEVAQGMLGMSAIASKGSFYFFVNDDVDFDTFFGLALQNRVKPPLLVLEGRATEILRSW